MRNLQMATALIEWWTLLSTSEPPRAWFTDDFVFDLGLEPRDIDEFVWRVEHTLPWSGVRVLQAAVDGQTATVFFEGVEGVTALRHRIAWFVRFQEDRICGITQVDAIVQDQ